MSARAIPTRSAFAAVPWIPLVLASLALVAREALQRRTELAEPVPARVPARPVLPSLSLRAEPPRAARSTWSVDADASTAVIDGGPRATLRVEGGAQVARDGSLEALDLELVPTPFTADARERFAIHASEMSRASVASPVPGVASARMRVSVGARSRDAYAAAAWSFDSAGRMHLAVRTHAGSAHDGDGRTFQTYDGEPPAQRLGLYLVLRNDDGTE